VGAELAVAVTLPGDDVEVFEVAVVLVTLGVDQADDARSVEGTVSLGFDGTEEVVHVSP
jgi:hypothetical protein